MMTVKLSSKGQLVIPKEVRQELGLKAGDELRVNVMDGKIVIRRQKDIEAKLAALDALYGSYTGPHD